MNDAQKGLSYIGRNLPLALLAVALLWYGWVILRFHTSGAMGNDPATYVQMALDLAATGTLTHNFPLFNNLNTQNLSWYALIPPGYRVTALGRVAPTYAFGLPLVLALGYRAVGERALDWGVPLLGLAALGMTYALGDELLTAWSPVRRRFAAALAVLVLVATPKHIQFALAPMSDVPTELWCALALYGALRARVGRAGSARARGAWIVLSGLALGMAYLTRHSALVMVVPLARVAWRWGTTARARIGLMSLALFTAALVALPDFLYRAQVFGNALEMESTDATRLNLPAAPAQLLDMLRAVVSLTGLGPFVLLAPVGLYSLWRMRARFEVLVLGSWPLAFLLLHAPLYLTAYFENDLRYLMPAYPALVLAASAGLVWMVTWPLARLRPVRIAATGLAPALALVLALALLAVSVRALVGPSRFAGTAYGLVAGATRADLESLDAMLPTDAVVGTSDQLSLAVPLYSHRDTFRPGALVGGEEEFMRVIRALGERPVYILGTWECPASTDPGERIPGWLAAHVVGQPVTIRNPYSQCLNDLFFVKESFHVRHSRPDV